MSSTPAQLPTLSPENHQLLLRYITANENPAALISPTFDLIEIYQWLASPEIAPWVALHREHTDRTLRTQIKITLRNILEHPANPIEARRAATTLLRALQPPRPARTYTSPRTPSPPRSPHSEPSGASRRPPANSPACTPAETPPVRSTNTPLPSLNTPPTPHPTTPASSSSPRPPRLCMKSSDPQMENARRNASGATPVLAHNPHSPARSLITAAGRVIQPSRHALGSNSS